MSQRRTPGGQGPRGTSRPAVPIGSRRVSGRSRSRTEGVPHRTRSTAAPAQVEHRSQHRSEHRAGPARRARTQHIRAPRRPARVSGRATALGLLLFALMLAYAYPVQVYLTQQAQIDQLRASQQAQRKRIQDLTDQLAKWNDDDYVVAQARSRLQMVRKGELFYVVIDPAAAPTGAPEPQPPWFSQVWSNLQGADNPVVP
jgi:cell division protein FtsB